jgi:pimeloyl-ACP methyl ester carboxylesterase
MRARPQGCRVPSIAATTSSSHRADAALRGAPPAALRTLSERFDPEVIDVPSGSAAIRLTVRDESEWDASISPEGIDLRPAEGSGYDARLSADASTWQRIADDLRGGMSAFHEGSLHVRRNLHLGVGFLAATSGIVESGRLHFASAGTRVGELSTLSAGDGDPVVCIHGLGATKASFLPTVAALADHWRMIAVDLPGFGESEKPLGAAYDARYFAGAVAALLDELGIESAHLIGNSMGGRVAIEVGLLYPERVERISLLSPALAWLRDRRWRWLLRAPLPMLGLLQPAPRVITEPIVRSLVPGGRDGWSAAGVDEFLRSYLTSRGRVAFYESARNIYLDEPHGRDGLWTRLAEMSPQSLFVWGRQDQLVPIGFRKHVERALPLASHLELDCGHVPQLEAPEQTHAAIREFFGGR